MVNPGGKVEHSTPAPIRAFGRGLKEVAIGQTPAGLRPTNAPVPTRMERQISRMDERMARFGGNDPRDPEQWNNEETPTASGRNSTSAGGEGEEGEHQGEGDGQANTRVAKEDEKDPNEVGWDGPDDPENPQNWSKKKKWYLTVLLSTATVCVTFASSAPSTTSQGLSMQFGFSTEVATLITTLFLCGYVAGPIIWSTGSELFGRKPIYSVSLLGFALFTLGQVLAQNPATLFVTRFLAGCCAAAPLTASGGIIADMWDAVGRGYAMSCFSGSVFIGPVLGPIVGGFVVQSYLGWRWVFWVVFFFGMTSWVSIAVLLPETFAPVLLVRKAKRLRKQDPELNKDLFAPHERTDWSIKGVAHRTLLRPFQIIAQEPILVLITIYLSVVYGLLYGLFEAFPIIWQELRGFNPGEGGLIFIGVGIGTTLGGLINVWLQTKYRHLTSLWKGHPPPEERLPGAMCAGPLLVIGCFWLGWTGAYPGVPWWVPALSTIPLGASFTFSFISFLSYIVDAYLMYSASALAANTIFRSAVGAGFPLFTRQMFTNLGVQWASTLLGCIAILLAPSPFLFYMYGSTIRKRSRFAPAIDLKIRKELEKEGKLPENSLRRGVRNGLAYSAKAAEKSEKEGDEQA